jgi:AraC-like DNA-binding protein
MLLSRLVANLNLSVDPFAVCDVRHGARLRLAPPAGEVLHFVLSGVGRLKVGAVSTPVGPDTMIVIPPGMGHTIESDEAGDLTVDADSADLPGIGLERVTAGDGEAGLLVACGRVNVTYGGLIDLFARLDAPLVIDFSDTPSVRAAFAALLDEQGGGRPGSVEMVAALMSQCFIQLLRRLCTTDDCRLPWLSALDDERLGRVLDEILKRPEAPHPLEGLAALAGMSRTAFSERFTEVFGRSAADFVKQARLSRAAHLLQTTDLPVKDIAGRVGFSSRSHFSRAFAEHYGRSPAEFRTESAAASQ